MFSNFDITSTLQALTLGIVEGLTEFLPISSTGHQIIVADLIGFGDTRAIAFNIIIQLGAILAVVWEFRQRIFTIIKTLPKDRDSQQFSFNLFLAFLPAAILGVLLSDVIETYLFNPITVSIALVTGGIIMLWVEKRPISYRINHVENMDASHALKIGLAQCLAMIPGTSRSASTIIGGLFFGLSRKAATEFSFFLAMPTMLGAAVYSTYKHLDLFTLNDLPIFTVGFITSFIFAMLSVSALLKFVSNHSYAVFAWYRIIFGCIILLTWHFGLINWTSVN